MSSLLRKLPAVEHVLQHAEIEVLLSQLPRDVVLEQVRQTIQEWRRMLLENQLPFPDYEKCTEVVSRLAEQVKEKLLPNTRPRLRRVINATGVVLHTNLGRAVLAPTAIEAVITAASGYTNLELDLATGKRGSRYAHVENLLTLITGAEAAMVVNNNAAAVLLCLSTLAKGKEVIVSRGQLVEIGGSFRIPEVMEQSGAFLVEVGATNKTYLRDYERAITPETALLLQVHTSNYRIVGFTRETPLAELVELGQRAGLPVMCDLGSGFLVDMRNLGLPYEPSVPEVVRTGADIVTFSGDKLLGGPQAGIIVGKRVYIEKMRQNPLTRALRIDKMTVAALEATLREYLPGDKNLLSIPTYRMLAMSREEHKHKARELAGLLEEAAGGRAEIEMLEGNSAVGGGAMPTADLPATLIGVKPNNMSVSELATNLRQGEPAVMGRLQDDRLLFDVRTLLKGEEILLAAALAAALTRREAGRGCTI
ncbi:MAG: L-seryl-tRNA(Sec) selenium transferase [Bacillota bacterium]|uniref:L-seryl-tRNA(Sec) selenium transferase n=1 Tax=Desulfurispora thermophila TaxID=265470 RepID=UPI000365FC98|nr:L-seryl-tRNA(Sec) selenium transferase [Desulfurispora thermophila]